MKETFYNKSRDALKRLFGTGFFHIFGANVVNKIIGFFAGVLIVRLISKAQYGVYTYVLNVVAIAEVFSALGMVSGVFQLNSENLGNSQLQDRVYNYGCSFGIRINAMISLVLLFIALFVRLPLEYANELLVFASIIPLFYVVPEFQLIYLRGRLKNKEYSYSNIICCFSISILTILGALVFDAEGAVLGRTISYICSATLIRILFKAPIFLKKGKIQSDEKKELFSISIVTMVNNGLSQLLYLVDVFIIGIVLTNSELVASYKVATTIPTALAFIPASIIIYIYPYFASHKEDSLWLKKSFAKLSVALLMVNIVIGSILFIFAPSFISVIFGNQYLDAVTPFRVLIINYVINASFRMLIGNILVMLRRLKYNLFESIISSLINCVADYFLIKNFAILGAAYATLLVTIVSSTISFVYFMILINKKQKRKISFS